MGLRASAGHAQQAQDRAANAASHLHPYGHAWRIRASTHKQPVLPAGFNSFLAACATSPPVNVFAQNNGIIAFTLCASRVAGVACAFWLFVFGVLAKVVTSALCAPCLLLSPPALAVLASSCVRCGILQRLKSVCWH